MCIAAYLITTNKQIIEFAFSVCMETEITHVPLTLLSNTQVNVHPSRHHPHPLHSQGCSRWVAGQLFSVTNSVYVSASAIM